jgi:PGF-CTERM protein
VQTERLFAAAAVVLLLAAGVVALVVPGVIANPDRVTRPGPVGVEEMTVAPGEVRGGTADLRVLTRIDHSGEPTPNVTVRFRAYGADSGLLVDEQTVDLGEVTGDRSRPVNGTLRVPREGGYVLETTVFRDGERYDQRSRRVSGVAALTPPYAQSAVAFSDGTALPPLSVAVAEADDNRTQLRVTASLENGGDDPSGDLRVAFRLRQAESNLQAGTASQQVGEIQAGRTGEATATVTVPSGYNYYVDAVLYRDDVVIDSARSVANLGPRERISADETVRDVEFDVEDFEGGGTDRGRDGEPTPAAATDSAAPGLGPGVALVALLATATLVVRRR